MNKIFILIGIFITVFYCSSGFSNELEYEKCDCSNQEMTDRVTSLFMNSDEHCVECSAEMTGVPSTPLTSSGLAQALSADNVDPNGNVSPKCILASNSKVKRDSGRDLFRMCNKERTTYFEEDTYKACGKNLYVRKYCSNEAYVKMTTHALNEVSKCVGVPPKSIFPLLNHESRFVLNNKSPTGALCYGQLTTGIVETLNNVSSANYETMKGRTRDFMTPESFESMKISTVLKNCPQLEDKFTKLEVEERKSKSGSTYLRYKDLNSHCNLIENPYSCLMYSIVNHKYNLEYAKNELENSLVGFTTNRTPRQYIFRDVETMNSFQDKVKDRDTWKEIKFDTGSMFSNPEQVAEIAAYFAYNGGRGTITVLFRDYLRQLSLMIDNSANKSLRADFLDGGFSTEFFYKNFRDYVKRNYRWGGSARKSEVSQFVGKILSDFSVISNILGTGTNAHCSNSESYVYDSLVKDENQE